MITHTTDAEDLTQKVFTRAMQAYGDFRQESEVTTWLHRIAMNLCVNYIRDKTRHRRVDGKSLDEEDREEGKLSLLDIVPNPEPAQLSLLEKDEVSRDLRMALAEMEAIYREVIVLREFQQMSYEEIAKVLAISVEAVGARLLRARNQLKIKMKRYM